MDLRKLVTTKMFLLLLIPFLIVAAAGVMLISFRTSIETYGVNKTVGWAWDLTNIYILAFPLYFIYLLGYGLLFLFKIKTNYVVSISHLTAIFFSFMYFDNDL